MCSEATISLHLLERGALDDRHGCPSEVGRAGGRRSGGVTRSSVRGRCARPRLRRCGPADRRGVARRLRPARDRAGAGARRRCAPRRLRTHRPARRSSASAAGLHRARVDLALDPAALDHARCGRRRRARGRGSARRSSMRQPVCARAAEPGSRRSPARSTAGCLRTARRAAAARATGTSARPSARICCSPPDSVPPWRSSSAREPRQQCRRTRSIALLLGLAGVAASRRGAGSRAR